LWDGAAGVTTAFSAIVRHRPRFVHTRTSVPAGIGLIAATLSMRPFLYDADSELSKEYVDGGHWQRGSLRHRVLAGIERVCRRRADAIVVLSNRLRSEFVDRDGLRAPITVIPCCVEGDRFAFDPQMREQRRAELGIGDGRLLVYVGKTGPRYMIDETIELAKRIRARAGAVRLLILTQDDSTPFEDLASRGQCRDLVVVRRAASSEVPGWLSAADAGLALIRPMPSERGSSPIKIGEYLAAGLPVITTPAVGDMSDAIDRHRLGVIIDRFDADGFDRAAGELSQLWSLGPDLRSRCTAWARATLSVAGVALPRYSALYDRLLESGAGSIAPAIGRVQ
jgi:glycosyltransferase involved in cell wall biosynthesis